MQFSQKSWRPFRLLGVGLLVASGLSVQAPSNVASQVLSSGLDRARKEPIIDGKGAGGIQLGGIPEAVIKTLGGQPTKTEQFEAGARQDLLYLGTDPRAQWSLLLGVVFRQDLVRAIWIVASRRPPALVPYEGSTSRGYRIGEPAERLRALYGPPDAVISDLGLQVFWWYQAAGLLVSPGERMVRGEAESTLMVLDPGATAADIRRLLHLR